MVCKFPSVLLSTYIVLFHWGGEYTRVHPVLCPPRGGGTCSPHVRWPRARGSGGEGPALSGWATEGSGAGRWPSRSKPGALMDAGLPRPLRSPPSEGIFYAADVGDRRARCRAEWKLAQWTFFPVRVAFKALGIPTNSDVGKHRTLWTYKRALYPHRHRAWRPLGNPHRLHLNQSAHRCLYTLLHLHIHVSSSRHRRHRCWPS